MTMISFPKQEYYFHDHDILSKIRILFPWPWYPFQNKNTFTMTMISFSRQEYYFHDHDILSKIRRLFPWPWYPFQDKNTISMTMISFPKQEYYYHDHDILSKTRILLPWPWYPFLGLNIFPWQWYPFLDQKNMSILSTTRIILRTMTMILFMTVLIFSWQCDHPHDKDNLCHERDMTHVRSITWRWFLCFHDET